MPKTKAKASSKTSKPRQRKPKALVVSTPQPPVATVLPPALDEQEMKEAALIVGLTPELMAKAIETAHDTCNPTCIHAYPLNMNRNLVQDIMTLSVQNSLEGGLHPAQGLFIAGVHVGYRAAMMVVEAANKAKEN